AAWKIPFLHVFPYSPRPGTPAARMPQVAVETRRRRAKDLRDLGGRFRPAPGAGQIGRSVTVLAERAAFGYADDFTPVPLRGGARPGALVRATVTGTTEEGVAATIADDAVAA
ncbi:MAG: tRNA (N(6)-L-threonylcarbamoyladenosine(37)-C(2))-methylthiotransferase MtaB, partial [Pseudomonadota bacterium]|nr:tRNA (N(6)-L-threonylcarbamoyladenosine(37)-C(2))-methylthiotransferase MtaB [Pseudomonadota bacterium]